MSGPATLFHEEQKFRLKRQRILLAIPPVSMTFLVIWQVILGHPWGKQPLSNNSVIGWTIFIWLVYLRLVTVRLVTEVRRDDLAVAMRGLWRARRIPLGEVKSVQAIHYDPVRDYGGYGIRTTRGGTAYLAGGNRAVRLELAKGGTVLIGSQRPEALVSAIKSYATRVSSA